MNIRKLSEKAVVAVLAFAFAISNIHCGSSSGSGRNERVEVTPTEKGPYQIAFSGSTPEFGQYTATGEITYAGGDQEGPQAGTGVAALQAEGGDVIVADLSCQPKDGGDTDFTFHWRDSITLSDGTVVSSTGQFIENKPPGLVTEFRCSVCCIQVCAPPPFNDCRFVCHSCNCRNVVIDSKNPRTPPGIP